MRYLGSSHWFFRFFLLDGSGFGQYRIILSTDTASEVRQPPEQCLSRQAGIVRYCLKYSSREDFDRQTVQMTCRLTLADIDTATESPDGGSPETIEFFLGLRRTGLPVRLIDSNSLVARLQETDMIGIVSEWEHP